MRSIPFLITVVFPVIGFCQSETPQRKLTSIGIIFSPDYSYRTLNFASSNQWVAEKRNKEEVPNIGFSTGVHIRYRLREKLTLETGLRYANKSLKTKCEALIWASSDPTLPTRSKTIYRFKYLVFPVSFSYSFRSRGKVNLFVTTGVTANIFLFKKTSVVTAGGNDNSHASSKQMGYSKINLSASIGVGVDYRLSKRFVLSAQPFYQRSLMSIVANRQAKEYLFSYGITTGIHYLL
jgi:hypothetical protein